MLFFLPQGELFFVCLPNTNTKTKTKTKTKNFMYLHRSLLEKAGFDLLFLYALADTLSGGLI